MVVSVTALNHYTTEANLKYFREAQQRDTRELLRMKATEDAQVMATEALIMGRIQAGQVNRLTSQLTETEKVAMDMIRVVHQQDKYIQVLIEALAAHGIIPPAPEAKSHEEKTEETPLVASSK